MYELIKDRNFITINNTRNLKKISRMITIILLQTQRIILIFPHQKKKMVIILKIIPPKVPVIKKITKIILC